MKKYFIVCLSLCLTVLSGELVLEGKPNINFYKDGKLMWLIDVQRANSMYNKEALEKYIINNSIMEEENFSYENYLLYVNSHIEYKYTNWRLPSIEELESIGLHDTFYSNLRVKHIRLDANQGPYNNVEEHKLINMRSIDEDVFYDFKHTQVPCYWSSTASTVKDNYLAGCFDRYRYKVELSSKGWRGRTSSQALRSKVDKTGFYTQSFAKNMHFIDENSYSSIGLRLVRDLNDNKPSAILDKYLSKHREFDETYSNTNVFLQEKDSSRLIYPVMIDAQNVIFEPLQSIDFDIYFNLTEISKRQASFIRVYLETTNKNGTKRSIQLKPVFSNGRAKLRYDLEQNHTLKGIEIKVYHKGSDDLLLNHTVVFRSLKKDEVVNMHIQDRSGEYLIRMKDYYCIQADTSLKDKTQLKAKLDVIDHEDNTLITLTEDLMVEDAQVLHCFNIKNIVKENKLNENKINHVVGSFLW